MQKLSKGSIDADRRIMAKGRVCTKITSIEPGPDGRSKEFLREHYNEKQWHSLYVFCWSHKDDFEFTYKQAGMVKALNDRQIAKLGIEIEDDEQIIMKNKVYTEEELKSGSMRIKKLREICIAKGIPDDGDKRAMVDAILEVQQLTED